MTSTPQTTLVEDFLLTAHLSENGRLAPYATGLDCGLSGAVLIELAAGNRIEIRSGKVFVINRVPLGHPVIDHVASCIADSPRHHSAQTWVEQYGSATCRLIISHLVTHGLLATPTRWSSNAIVNRRFEATAPQLRATAIDRLSRALDLNQLPDARTANLIVLLRACGVSPASVGDLPENNSLYLRAQWPELQLQPAPAIEHIATAVAAAVLAIILTCWS